MTDLSDRPYLLMWATDADAAHSQTPQRAACEAAGWVRIGGDSRYPHMHLMRLDGEWVVPPPGAPA